MSKMAAAHEAKARANDAKRKTIKQQVEAVLEDPRISGELKRKLQYCQDSVEGKVPRSDASLMAEVRTKLIREAKRSLAS